MTYLLTSRSKSFSFDVGMYGGLLTMTSNGKYEFNTTFNNISALLVEETRENH
jgi:hypothetical protein